MPSLGKILPEFPENLTELRTRMMGLSKVIHLATIPACDGQTDGRTRPMAGYKR